MNNLSKIIQLLKNSSLEDKETIIAEIQEKGFTLQLKEKILQGLAARQSQYLQSSQAMEKLLDILEQTKDDIAAVDENANLKITQISQKAQTNLERLENK